MPDLPYISAREIRETITMKAAIDAMRDAFAALSSGKAVVPDRLHLELGDGTALFMPASMPSTGLYGTKIVSINPGNTDRGLPLIHALIVVMNARTGHPEAVIEGSYLTALRTGAASGLATDMLARPDARVAVVFGAGAQGRTQLEAVCAVRKIRKAHVVDPVMKQAFEFANEMSGHLSIPIEISKADIVSQADVICTATTSSSPVFDPEDIPPGVHINAVGAYTPTMQEIPSETVAVSKVVVDSRKGCLAEAGDILIPLNQGLFDTSHISTELGELVIEERIIRTGKSDKTLFKSVGNAVQDLAVAHAILTARGGN